MGSLALPASGSVYVDTSIIIYSVLHAATAAIAGCVMFLTNDEGFRRVGGLRCAILRDIVGG